MRSVIVAAACAVLASACGSAESSTDDGAVAGDEALASRAQIMAGTERARAHAARQKPGATTADVQAASVHFGNAYWLARLSDLSYWVKDANAPELTAMGFAREETRVFANPCSGAFALYVATPDAAVLVFRGTDMHGFDDPATQTDIEKDLTSFKTTWEGPGLVHAGFLEQLDSLWDAHPECGVTEGLGSFLTERRGPPLYLTGHSLGAAVATLLLGRTLVAGGHIDVSALYTFGSPKVGTDAFAMAVAEMARDRTPIFRVVHKNDLVTGLPRNLLPGEPVSYRHVAYARDGEDGFQVWVDGPSRSISKFVLHLTYDPSDHDTSHYVDDMLVQARLFHQLH